MSSLNEKKGKSRRQSVSRGAKGFPMRRHSISRIDVPKAFDAKFLEGKDNTEQVKDFFKSNTLGVGFAARKGLSDIEGTRAPIEAIKKAGGIELMHRGNVQVKAAGMTQRYKEKHMVLEKGYLTLYNIKDIPKEQSDLPAVLPPDMSLSLLELRAIGYQRRGDKVFGLVFAVADQPANTGNNSGGNRMFGRRRRRSSVSNNQDTHHTHLTTNSASSTFQEKPFFFKFRRGSEAEVWLAALMCELKNQAKFLELSVSRMLKSNDNRNDTIEGMLRQCVDLYQLSLGKMHKTTMLAQDRLGKYLRKDKTTKLEGRFWCKVAQMTGKLLKKVEKDQMAEFILTKTKWINADSPVTQLQAQTEMIHKLKLYKDRVLNMQAEAQKWKARAILYGYGDKRAKQSPLQKLSMNRQLSVPKPEGSMREKEVSSASFNIDEGIKHIRTLESPAQSKIEKKPDIQPQEREKKKSFNSHFTLTTSVGGKQNKDLKSLPSILNDTDADTDANSNINSEVEGDYDRDAEFDHLRRKIQGERDGNETESKSSKGTKATAEPARKSFVRPIEFKKDDNDFQSAGEGTESGDEDFEDHGIWGKARQFSHDLQNDFYLRSPIHKKSEPKGEVEPVEVEEPEHENNAEHEETQNLMRDFLNDRLEETAPAPEAVKPVKKGKRVNLNKLDEMPTLLTHERSTMNEMNPKKQQLIRKLNSFDGGNERDLVPIDLNILKNEFEEMKQDKPVVIPDNFEQVTPTTYMISKKVDKATEKQPACYLLYSPANKGTLYMRWSKRDLAQEALMKFAPPNPDKIPSYKYRIKSGLIPSRRDELARNVTVLKPKLFQGVNEFLKEAGKYNGNVMIFGNNVNFKTYVLDESSSRISQLMPDVELNNVANEFAAAVTVEKNNDSFDGIKISAKNIFLADGRKKGSSIDFSRK